MRKKHTEEIGNHRQERHEKRRSHIQGLLENSIVEELPDILVPEVFKGIQDTYWECLKSIPDPRNPDQRVYPLHLILHRVISGFIDGSKYIGILFPRKRIQIEVGKRKLGALPTRKAVYTLLRRIDWPKANEILAPLWDILGHTPNLVVRREFRNPKVILDEFREEQKQKEMERLRKIREEQEAIEAQKGMSAAKAKQSGSVAKPIEKEAPKKTETVVDQKASGPTIIEYDLVMDGKVVKASYNSGVKERFVHVTEIRTDENGNRSRFIIGTCPTVLDRNGEWGACLSILDSLLPLPRDVLIIVSGDAGFCVEEFCKWLEEKGFFLHLSDKRKRR